MKSRLLPRLFRPATYVAFILALTGCDSRYSASRPPAADIYQLAIAQASRSREDRRADAYRKPHEILKLSGVMPNMVVVDLFGGSGFYAELFNSIVGPGGAVYLQNNSLFLRFSTEGLEKRLQGGRLENVRRLDSEFADLKLPADVDVIFMGLSFHDIYVPREDPVIMTSPEEFFPQIRASLKPGGRLLIVDHAAAPGSGASTTPTLHRIDRDFAISEIADAGFELIATSDLLANPADDYSADIWSEGVFHNTDRFILLFEKK